MYVKTELDVNIPWTAVPILKKGATIASFQNINIQDYFSKLHGSVEAGQWRPKRLPITLAKMHDLYELRRKYIPADHEGAQRWYLSPPAPKPKNRIVEYEDDDVFADADERNDFFRYIDGQ